MALEPWTYLSPALVIIATVLVVPLVIGISYSLRKFSAFRSEYVGLGQYRTMLGDEVFHPHRRRSAHRVRPDVLADASVPSTTRLSA